MGEQEKETWKNLKKGEILFLVSFNQNNESEENNFLKKYKIQCVRGCEISQIYNSNQHISDSKTVLNVFLDPSQYRNDMESDNPFVYQEFRILVKRKNKKKSKFKSVLASLREIIKEKIKFPSFLEDFLVRGIIKKENPETKIIDISNLTYNGNII